MANETNLIGTSSQTAVVAVKGECTGPGGFGVQGICDSGAGVVGNSITSKGVVGTSKSFVGVFGTGKDGLGVIGLSQKKVGVKGESHSPTTAGVLGINEKGGDGVSGFGKRGVVGESIEFQGVSGKSRDNAGIVGESENFHAIFGVSHSVHNGGVIGINADHNNVEQGFGVIGRGSVGVAGESHNQITAGVLGTNEGGGPGVLGKSSRNGVVGQTSSNTDAGVNGRNNGNGFGVFGGSNGGAGVEGHSKTGNCVVGFSEKGKAGLFLGDVEVTGDIKLTGGNDVAENFSVINRSSVSPGCVMTFKEDGSIETCSKSYDKKVVGVISGAGDYKPGLILGKEETEADRMPIALMGKVFCWVDADFSSIEVGDMLTTSSTNGHAMKAKDPFAAFGAVIGKALKPLLAGKGLIPVLVALQ